MKMIEKGSIGEPYCNGTFYVRFIDISCNKNLSEKCSMGKERDRIEHLAGEEVTNTEFDPRLNFLSVEWILPASHVSPLIATKYCPWGTGVREELHEWRLKQEEGISRIADLVWQTCHLPLPVAEQ